MFKNMNRKQKIFVIAILLLIVVSAMIFLSVFALAAYNDYIAPDSEDDIFGPDYGRYLLAIGLALFSIPYFTSLMILLHGGYYILKSTPFSIAKCVHCISSTISLSVISVYIWFCVGIVSGSFSEEFLVSMPSGDTLGMICLLVWGSIIFLDIIGTVLHKREKKRQLKSVDSQKTE